MPRQNQVINATNSVATTNNTPSIKHQLDTMVSQPVNGVTMSPSTKMMVSKNYLRLLETKTKNSNLYEKLINSTNRNTTLLTLINNSAGGLELGEHFYFVPMGSTIAEIKNGRGWKALAEQFSVEPIAYIKVIVVSRFDKCTLTWDKENDTQMLEEYIEDFEHKVTFDDIKMCIGIVKYKNGMKKTRIINKFELLKMKEVSPTSKSQSSPWNAWPKFMVEAKIFRELIRKEVTLDTKKMASLGYSFVEDDAPIQVISGENETLITNANIFEKPKPVDERQALLTEITNLVSQDDDLKVKFEQFKESKNKPEVDSLTDDELKEFIGSIYVE